MSDTSGQDYPIYLRDGQTDDLVDALLVDGITEAHLQNVETQWFPFLIQELKRLLDEGKPVQSVSQNLHWNWRNKMQRIRGLLAYRSFAVVCTGQTQGLMQVNTSKFCRAPVQRGKPLVCVDYLEAAPWNRRNLVTQPRYGGVGTVMITAAIELSRAEGFHGRVGLHSLPQADGFYANACGMTDLGQDPAVQNLRYFEMTPEQANAFKSEGVR